MAAVGCREEEQLARARAAHMARMRKAAEQSRRRRERAAEKAAAAYRRWLGEEKTLYTRYVQSGRSRKALEAWRACWKRCPI